MKNIELKTYIEISEKYPNEIVFIKKDDMYIVFSPDMVELLSLMKISINQIPYYELEKYLNLIIKKGKKVITVG